MLMMGLVLSPWAILLIPAAVLTAFGFAAVGMGVTTHMRDFQDLDMVNLFVLPMFLFSGTFYSLSVYPVWLRIAVERLPLHHGVALMRALSVGVVNAGLLVHVGYFVAMAAGGVLLTSRRLDKLLLFQHAWHHLRDAPISRNAGRRDRKVTATAPRSTDRWSQPWGATSGRSPGTG
jgi:lipooligosaccharide transport system permease protein